MKEKEEILKESLSMLQELREAGVDFIFSAAIYRSGEIAKFDSQINVYNDHHMLDLQYRILDSWSRENHSKDIK
jgi:hypothetical protein